MRLTATIHAGLSLIALTLSAPAAISHFTIHPTTARENTRTKKYRCDGRNLICCEITAGGTCFAADTCETYCFSHDHGASCVDMGKSVATTSNNIDISIAARDTSPQENKHYTCSKDHTGVLICKYGFCSTDHYCKTYDECKSDCNCCRRRVSSTQGSKTEIRTLPAQVENAAMRMVAKGRN